MIPDIFKQENRTETETLFLQKLMTDLFGDNEDLSIELIERVKITTRVVISDFLIYLTMKRVETGVLPFKMDDRTYSHIDSIQQSLSGAGNELKFSEMGGDFLVQRDYGNGSIDLILSGMTLRDPKDRIFHIVDKFDGKTCDIFISHGVFEPEIDYRR